MNVEIAIQARELLSSVTKRRSNNLKYETKNR